MNLFSALVQFKDVSTGFPGFETRVIITFYHNDVKYHLKSQGVNGELFAIVSVTVKAYKKQIRRTKSHLICGT